MARAKDQGGKDANGSAEEDRLDNSAQRFLDDIIKHIKTKRSWKERAQALLDVVDVIEPALGGAQDAATKVEAPKQPLEPDQSDDDLKFPYFIALILRELGNPAIKSVDQAVFYLLSADQEHHTLLEDWLDADERRDAALRKLIGGDQRLRRLVELLDEQEKRYESEDEDEP